MRRVPALVLCLGVLGACSSVPSRPARPAAAPPQPDPFDPGSVSFTVSGPRFAPGESAIVRVCVSPDGVIASADLLLPSGDKRFDDFALGWARQVKLSGATQAGTQRQEICGPVRVEIRASPQPRVLSGADTSLG